MGKPKKFVVGGLLNLGYGLATAGASYAQRQKALRQMAQLDAAESGNVMSMAARRRVAQQESDAQAAIDAAARASASQLAAAQEAGGSRAVQAISPEVARAQEEAVARSLARFGEYGSRASQQEDAGIMESSQARLLGLRSGFERAADMATQNMVQGLGLAAGGLAQTIGGIGPRQKKTAQKNSEPQIRKEVLSSWQNTQAERDKIVQDISGIQDQLDQEQVPLLPATASKIANKLAPTSEFNLEDKRFLLPSQMKKGGVVSESKAMKTPGTFSHKSNPIDVIKDGRKIAEMTGGEYIFNPKQSQKLRNLSEGGNSALHKFVRDLLSKRQFK